MIVEELPGYVQFVTLFVKKLDEFFWDLGLMRHGLAPSYERCAYPDDKIFFGAEAPGQVDENLKCWHESFPVDIVDRVRLAFY